MPPGPKRTPFQIEADRLVVTRLYLQGYSQRYIGDQLKVTQPQISYDLKAIRERWREEANQLIEDHIARELKKVDNLEMVYWLAWDDSKKPKEITRTQLSSDDPLALVAGQQPTNPPAPLVRKRLASTTREQRDPNPAYLEGVRWCIDRRCKLLGLDAPDKIDLGVTKLPVEYYRELENLTDEQLRARAIQEAETILKDARRQHDTKQIGKE